MFAGGRGGDRRRAPPPPDAPPSDGARDCGESGSETGDADREAADGGGDGDGSVADGRRADCYVVAWVTSRARS